MIRTLALSCFILSAASTLGLDCVPYDGVIHYAGGSHEYGLGDLIDIQAHGDLAVALSAQGWLIVLEESAPGIPEMIGHVHVPDAAEDLDWRGGLVAVAVDDHDARIGFELIDLSQPTAPVSLGFTSSGGVGSSCVALGEGVCAVGGWDGVRLYNLSDLANPQLAGLTPAFWARQIDLDGSRLLVNDATTYYSYLRVFDVGDITAPTSVGQLFIPGGMTAMLVHDSTIFTSSEHHPLMIIDVSLPGQPVVVGAVQGQYTWYESLLLIGDHLLASGWPLGVYNVSELANPELVSSMHVGIGHPLIDWNGTVYAGVDGGLAPLDPGEFVTASPMVEMEESGRSNGVAAEGQLIYLSDESEAGLVIIDTAHPDGPTVVGRLLEPSGRFGVAAQDGWVYLTSSSDDLLVLVDAREPSQPVMTGSVSIDNVFDDVVVQDGVAYAHSYHYHLTLIDVSDPDVPTLLDPLELPSYCRSMVLHDGWLHCLLGNGEIHTFDLGDPTQPSLASTMTAFAITDIAMAGHHLYGIGNGRSLLVDVADPQAPETLDGFFMPWRGENVAASTGALYVGTYYGTLLIYDLTDPIRPTMIAMTATARSSTVGVAPTPHLLAVSCSGCPLQIYAPPCTDAMVSAPDGPVEPTLVARLRAAPNPFNPRTSLHFRLPRSGPAKLCIHDVAGRRVRTLVQGHAEAGDHTVTWNGRDDAGRNLPSGVYLARLEAVAHAASRRLTLIR